MVGTIALVLAAGRGQRFGDQVPKQYQRLHGRPLLAHALTALAQHPAIDAVRAVIHADDRAYYARAAQGLALLEPVEGGATRQESVHRGLESLQDLAPDRVLIHDGARPFLPKDLIDRVLQALDEAPCALPALPVTDTLKRGAADRLVAETVSRDNLWRAQTPQGFHFSGILRAHRAAVGEALTDDAAVAERAGLAVRLVEGAEENIKVTSAADLERAEQWLMTQAETRSGIGFDVHRFGPGDHVMLCGIAIPHSRGLQGHSDADVGLHALSDALLGTIAAGDIGQHFPPTDPRWKNADSAEFLAAAGTLLSVRGGRILNLDVTLICEAPKVAPYRGAMTERIADILSIDPGRVSIKATTTEGLGFAGRREGIAAQAIVTVSLPRERP